MPCYHPIEGYRGPGGKVTFVANEGWRDLPTVQVDCGHCFGCRLEYSRQWAVRCMHEASQHDHNTFITLTYSDEHLPDNGSLDLAHWQKFAKRTRKQEGKFRYFHCGEYGDENWRPHYHALLFGLDFSKDRKLCESNKDYPEWTSKTLDKLWGKGITQLGSLTWETALYVAKYAMKKANGKMADYRYMRINYDTGEEYKIRPEYVTMSRNKGIAHAWIEKYNDEVYRDDFVVIKGKEAKTPKYYDKYKEKLDPKQYQKIKENRKKQGQKHKGNRTKEKLKIREKIAKAKGQLTKRKL